LKKASPKLTALEKAELKKASRPDLYVFNTESQRYVNSSPAKITMSGLSEARKGTRRSLLWCSRNINSQRNREMLHVPDRQECSTLGQGRIVSYQYERIIDFSYWL
jgi:hypothetical protein